MEAGLNLVQNKLDEFNAIINRDRKNEIGEYLQRFTTNDFKEFSNKQIKRTFVNISNKDARLAERFVQLMPDSDKKKI